IFDLQTHETTPVAHSRRSERDPMWIGNRIYFASDRDGILNLYSYDVESEEVKKETHSSVWDVRWPSSDNSGQIVYELNGELHVFDTQSGRERKLSIFVPNDGVSMRSSRYSAEENIEGFGLSPGGERALFVARGDVFTAPVEKGPTRNLTNSSSAHDKHARWSPDGRRIAFVSDADGEEQIYLIDQDGSGQAERLTDRFRAMLYAPEWSPDGSRLAFSDKDGNLYSLNVSDRAIAEVARDEFIGIFDYSWSPDGRWLAFSMNEHTGFQSLYIWSVEENLVRRATGPYFHEQSPVWDPDGKYLYYLSDREFAPQISSVEWNYAGNRQGGIFALALQKDAPHPFSPESDEVKIDEGKPEASPEKPEDSEAGSEKKAKPDEEPAPKNVSIDFEGLQDRVIRIPVDPDNISALATGKGTLLYVTSGPPYYGRSSDRKPALQVFDFKERKSTTLADGISGMTVSGDGTKVLTQEGKSFHLYSVAGEGKDKKTVSTANLMVDRVPAQEWEQIFNEVWRRYRDFFYVRNMHGYDWEAIGERYRQWLPFVAHRSDLNYVLGEMVAELNVGHAYIAGGDFEIPERPKTALPGARFELDAASNRYRISRIFRGDNQEEKYRSPLAEVGLEASVGDYVLAIDGEELSGDENPYRLLQHKTDPVTLTLNSEPTREGGRQVRYRPVTSEADLLYRDWVQRNRDYVSEKTGGRVGYIHIPDMGANGIYEFIKWYYPQIRKEGMVVDVRSNGGGNVSQWILARLSAKLLGTRFGYSSDYAMTYPYTVFHGHLVCLINQTSASDGDIFPHRFRKAGLGPLIGKRTWGGVVGISSRGPLIDGGQVFVPLQATNDVDGSWIIEGEGVTPDIEVDNDPASVIAGRDPQLDRGIQEVLQRMEANPMRLPSRPPDPVKTP
ncbi:MAG TPA: S41 family peptidase, partial [Acidobacteriota bacterium]|nr:S41 family peptidase [Acidobacteriota bacterium]